MIKNKMNQKARNIVLVFVFLFSINFVLAANVGISPAKVSFEEVLRNGYAERSVVISIDTPESTMVKIDPRGEIAEWLNFSEREFEVSLSNPHILLISVEPPADVPNGNYSGFIRVETTGSGETPEGRATGVVKAALDLNIEVGITDFEKISCKASNFLVESVEQGDDIGFEMKILNEGNVKLSPRISVEVWDENQIEIIHSEEFSGQQIKPTVQEEISFGIDSDDFDTGQYWVEVSAVDCYQSETLTFDVLEEGALKAQGILTEIVVFPRVNVKETTTIEAYFENTGEKNVNAQFKGEILYGSRIVQILESEIIGVSVGENNNFKFYFTPQNSGKYIVSGRVFYDGKKTYEKSATINAVSGGMNFKNSGKIAAYVVLFGIISFMIYRIRKERKILKKKYGGLGK